jgi:hypothetical protein
MVGAARGAVGRGVPLPLPPPLLPPLPPSPGGQVGGGRPGDGRARAFAQSQVGRVRVCVSGVSGVRRVCVGRAPGEIRTGMSVRRVGSVGDDRSVGRSGGRVGRARGARSGAVGRSSRSVGVVRKGPLSELATTSDRASRNGHRGRERGGPLESVERRSCDGRCALVVSAVCPCPSCRSICAINAKVATQPSSLTWSAPQVVRHECRPPRANVRLGRTTRAPCTSNCRLTMPLVSLSLSPVAHIMQPAQSRRRSRGRST